MNAKAGKRTKGFTLMELIIVMALLAIIAAILIPMFLNTTDRARLRSDIQSARVIQNAMELYRAETGAFPLGTDIEAQIARLAEAGFISDGEVEPQTEDAEWDYVENIGVVVDIYDSPDSVHSAYRSLTAAEQQFVVRGRAAGGQQP